ncbi:MAG TPA: hypothetical protein VF463_12840 [Sphingobium sp.]
MSLAFMLAMASSAGHAAKGPGSGDGYDCFFQVRAGELARVRLWYGAKLAGNAILPYIEDTSRLLLLNAEGKSQSTLRINDQRPESLTVNYFRTGGGLPLALLTIFKTENAETSAQIAHLPSDLKSSAEKIVPSKTYSGLCRVTTTVIYDAFMNGVPAS